MGRLLKFNLFVLVPRYTSGKIFTKIRSVVLTRVANTESNAGDYNVPPGEESYSSKADG